MRLLVLIVLLAGCEARLHVDSKQAEVVPEPPPRMEILDRATHNGFIVVYLVRIDNKEYLVRPDGGIIEHEHTKNTQKSNHGEEKTN